VQHVALLKLPLCGVQDLAPRDLRLDQQPCQGVLELIAKAKSPAGLVEPGAAIEAAGKALIQQPAVEHEIDGRQRGLDLHSPEQAVPVALGLVPGSPGGLGCSVSRRQGCSLFWILPLAHSPVQLLAGAGRQVDVHLQYRADLAARLYSGLEAHLSEGGWLCRSAAQAKEGEPIRGIAVQGLARDHKGGVLAELHVVGITRRQAAGGRIKSRHQMRPRGVRRGAQYPFHVQRGRDAARHICRVFQAQTHDLDGVRWAGIDP